MSTINPTSKVHSQYGEPMGQPSFGHGSDPSTTFELHRIRINRGGYDDGGVYWGIGQPLYWYCAYATEQVENGRPCQYCNQAASEYRGGRYNECNSPMGEHVFPMRDEEIEISDYIRADSREHAKAIIKSKYPQATFKR